MQVMNEKQLAWSWWNKDDSPQMLPCEYEKTADMEWAGVQRTESWVPAWEGGRWAAQDGQLLLEACSILV